MHAADVTKMTRAQGERAVAATTDTATLKLLGDHKNSHVRAKANYKYGALMQARAEAATEYRLVEPDVDGARRTPLEVLDP